MGKWKDCTTHSQGDIEQIPRIWKQKFGDLWVTVHRHMYYPNDMWLLTCAPFFDTQELSAPEIEQAKATAIAMVQIKLQDALDEINGG